MALDNKQQQQLLPSSFEAALADMLDDTNCSTAMSRETTPSLPAVAPNKWWMQTAPRDLECSFHNSTLTGGGRLKRRLLSHNASHQLLTPHHSDEDDETTSSPPSSVINDHLPIAKRPAASPARRTNNSDVRPNSNHLVPPAVVSISSAADRRPPRQPSPSPLEVSRDSVGSEVFVKCSYNKHTSVLAVGGGVSAVPAVPRQPAQPHELAVTSTVSGPDDVVTCVCRKKCQRADMQRHLAELCSNRKVACSCGRDIAFSRLAAHKKRCGAITKPVVGAVRTPSTPLRSPWTSANTHSLRDTPSRRARMDGVFMRPLTPPRGNKKKTATARPAAKKTTTQPSQKVSSRPAKPGDVTSPVTSAAAGDDMVLTPVVEAVTSTSSSSSAVSTSCVSADVSQAAVAALMDRTVDVTNTLAEISSALVCHEQFWPAKCGANSSIIVRPEMVKYTGDVATGTRYAMPQRPEYGNDFFSLEVAVDHWSEPLSLPNCNMVGTIICGECDVYGENTEVSMEMAKNLTASAMFKLVPGFTYYLVNVGDCPLRVFIAKC